jgi:DNA-binding GntR family transcriptional regulator
MHYRTKQEFVYRTLRTAILRCDFAPGERLFIEELARQLEVSPIPVREAMQLLQSEGLVTAVPHVGATVSRISRDSVDEVFTVMEALELVAVRTAAQRLGPEDAASLDELVGAMDRALAERRYEEWADLNSAFHLAISRLSGMPLLHEMMGRVFDRWDRVRRYYFNGVLLHRIGQAQDEHRAIVEVMKQRDLSALEDAVRRHNQGALLAYSEYLRERTAS